MRANLGFAHSCNDGQTFLLGKERSASRNIPVIECVPPRLGELVHVLFAGRYESRRQIGQRCRSDRLPRAEPKVFNYDLEHASLPGRRSAGTRLIRICSLGERIVDTKLLTQRGYVLNVLLLQDVPAMETNYPLRRNTSNSLSADQSCSEKRAVRIHDSFLHGSVETVPPAVENNGVDVDLAALVVAQHKIPRGRVVARHVSITFHFHEAPKLRDILLLNHNIQVVMGPRLALQQRIDAPASVDPHVYSTSAEPPVQLAHVRRRHHGL